MRRVGIAFAIVLAIACDRSEPEPTVAQRCALSPIEAWMSERGEIALASSGALIAQIDRGAVAVRPLAEDAAISRWRMEGATAVLAIEPIASDHHALIAYGACEGAPCLIARAVAPDGAPTGEVVRSPFAAALRTSKRASSGGRAYLAWSTDGGERALESWWLEGGSLAHETLALGAEEATREMPVEILALAARGTAWAVIWRRGPTEATESSVFLTTRDRHAALEALHEALAIDALAIERDRILAIATFEFSRPHLLSLVPGESEPASAEELTSGETPRAFSDRVRAELDRDAEGLWLRRRTAAGDPIDERVRIAEGDVRGARIAGDGHRLIVAWRSGDRALGRRVVCPR